MKTKLSPQQTRKNDEGTSHFDLPCLRYIPAHRRRTLARLFAIDRSNGDIVWKKDLSEASSNKFDQFKGSWATPRIIDNDGRDEMIIPLPGQLTSFDPNTGAELWRCAGLSYTDALMH